MTGRDDINAAIRLARLRGTARPPAEDDEATIGRQNEEGTPTGSADAGAGRTADPEPPTMNNLLRGWKRYRSQRVHDLGEDR